MSRDEYSGKPVTDMVMAEMMLAKRQYNAPRVGELAPPFEILDHETGEPVTLASLYKEKPVVLFFGSYGCDVLGSGVGELLKVHQAFQGKVNFQMIYIREAHSLDWIGALSQEGSFSDPRTDDERKAMAARCGAKLTLPFPIGLDTLDDRIATRWGAWPLRLFVIGSDGKVLYAARRGPWGFRPTEDFSHGDGTVVGGDVFYNGESLESFLKKLTTAQE